MMMMKKKKQRTTDATTRISHSASSALEALPEEILSMILSRCPSSDLKSISLASKSLHDAESRHRTSLTLLRPDFLPSVLSRYPAVSHLVLTPCRRVPDSLLSAASAALPGTLVSVDLSRSWGFGAAGLDALVGWCQRLVDIDVSNVVEFGDQAAAAVGRARNLERLVMTGCRMVTDVGIGRIAVGCGRLRELRLKWCFGISDLGVGLVAVKCRKLQILDLSYVPITNKCLPAILLLQHLKELAVSGCQGIDEEGLMPIKKECKSLELLDLSHWEHVTHTGLSSLTDGVGNLRHLVLSYCFPFTNSMANSLQKLNKLNSIKLDGCRVTCSGLKTMGTCCSSLQELSLSKCFGVTDEALSFLVDKNKQLKRLNITCCRNISQVSIASITSSCSSLVSLRMESCSLVSKEAFVLIGKHCYFLEDLDLTDTEIDDEGLKAISACSRLSCLRIGICLNISDNGLVHVGRSCKTLEEVDLYRSVGITDEGVNAIALGCPDLKIINLAYCTEITDYSLRSLSICSKLNTLEIRGCYRVTSCGLSAIAAGCKQIINVDIKKCYNINDSGILPLARCSHRLKQINLSYCSVTDLGLLALASVSCLQSMTILHVMGLTPNGIAATLLACGGLTKVKLHMAYKSLLPQQIIYHIQSQGCVFQWSDKQFQVEVKHSKLWKQELEKFYNDDAF